MNCWKSISIENQFGKDRLLFLSFFTMLSYFILHFVFFRTFVSNTPFVDFGLTFLFLIIAIIPIHILLHCIPVWIFGKKATVCYRNNWPYFNFSVKQTLPKHLVIISIASPVVVVTTISIIISIVLPQWMHYMAMLAAVNMGLSVHDLLYLNQLKAAPKQSVIEEFENGYHVLYKGAKS